MKEIYTVTDVYKEDVGKYYTKYKSSITYNSKVEFELDNGDTYTIYGQSWIAVHSFGDEMYDSARVLFAKDNTNLLLFILPYGCDTPTVMSVIDYRLVNKDSINHFMRMSCINGSKQYTLKGNI
jgi:hypothetical protein